VYRLGPHAFYIGTELAAGETGLSLGASLGGVSRRHCSIRRGTNGIELVDHSRFGTRLNGHAIETTVILQAGDVIGIGSPLVHLRLVREVDVGSGTDGT
jgi:pSer/pThr/pTyr-binding forkhead associated (FHA) protein